VEANGVLRKIQSEADAVALYGSAWAKRVVDVADSFFTNYTIGTPLASGNTPAGSLVKVAGNSAVYYYDGATYRNIATEAAFNANRFDFANVITVAAIGTLGAPIAGAEETFIKDSQSGVTGGVQPGQGTGLTVALSSATPAGISVPKNGTRVPFTKINITASNDGATNLEALTIKRTGLSDYSAFAGTNGKIWAEKDGVRVTSQRSMNSNDEAILTFAPVINIPAGQTITLEIVASLNAATGNGALGIATASAVTASGAIVSGSFPIMGNLMSFTDYTVAQVAFDGSDTNKVVKVGDTNTELGSFDINSGATSKNVIFKSVMLRNSGVEDLGKAVNNLYLEKNGTIVSGAGVIADRYVTFTLNNGGLLIEKDDDATLKVKGDIIGKDNTATTSLSLKLNKTDDISVIEQSTGFGAEITATDLLLNDVEIQSGALSLTKKSTSPSDTDIIKGAKGVVSLIANVRADEAITADEMKVRVDGATATTSFENVKAYVNGYLLGSFDLTSDGDLYTIDSTVNFNKGDNEVKLTVDAKSTGAVGGHYITLALQGAGNFLTNPEYVSNGNPIVAGDINGSPTGAKLTIQGADVTVVRNDGYADGRKIVKGTKDAVLAKFNVKAVYDSVKLNSITLAANSGSATQIADSSVYDMKLFVDGVQIGTTRDFSAGATFSSLNYTIAKDTVKSIELRGSFDTANTGYFKTVATFDGEDSRGKAITPKTGTTADLLVAEQGTLNVAIGADTTASSVLLAKAGVEQEIAQYRITAVDDAADVTELTFLNVLDGTTGSSTVVTTTDSRIAEYRLYSGSTLLSTDNPLLGTTTFKITGSKLIVPANGNSIVSLRAVFNNIDTAEQTKATLLAKVIGYKFKSSNGSEIINSTSTVLANNMVIRKTKPTFAYLNGVAGGQSSNQEVLRFTISADSNEDVLLSSLTFAKSGSTLGMASTSDFKIYEVSGSTETQKSVTGVATTTFNSLNVTVAKGTSKTFVVRANTSAIATDESFGLNLDNTTLSNIQWKEYFVTDNETYTVGDASYLKALPITGATMKY
jgi:hypothetical protein